MLNNSQRWAVLNAYHAFKQEYTDLIQGIPVGTSDYVARAANALRVSPLTVRRILAAYNKTGTVEVAHKAKGVKKLMLLQRNDAAV